MRQLAQRLCGRQKGRFWASLLMLAAALFMAWPLPAKTLHRGIGPEPDSLDMHRAQSVSALNLLRDLHEGLLTLDAGGRVIPGVARQWRVSDSGRVWTFELDERARYSDGSPVRARDFVNGWRRAMSPDTASPLAWMLDVVENGRAVRTGQQPADSLGIEAVGETRLKVRLHQPTEWFEQLLTQPLTAPWSPSDRPRYSGAFVLNEHVPGAHLALEANRFYHHADEVALARVVWHVTEQPGPELARYRAGGLHITETIPPGRAEWLAERFGSELHITPYLGSFYLAFNLDRPPFAGRPGLRRTLSLAIDRDILTERVLGSGELPAWGLVPPGIPGWQEGRPPPLAEDKRLDEARRLYAEAGHGDSNPLVVELRINSSLAQRRLATAVAAMWKMHLGVHTRLVNEEWKVFVANRRQGRLTQIVRGGWIADWPDAANFLDLFVGNSPGNYTFFDDVKYNRLMEKSRTLRGQGRIEALREAEARLLDKQVIVPLYYYVSRHLVDSTVRGFEDNPADVHLSRWLALP